MINSRLLIMFPKIVVFLVLLFLYMLCSQGFNSSSSGEPKMMRCIETEREALLKIKQDLRFLNHSMHMSYLLSSWGNEEEKRECCKWFGIECDNNSGHVIKLDLSPSAFTVHDYFRSFNLEGNISSSLRELLFLEHLDLSFIYLYGSRIPSFMGMLSNLRYLNLSSTYIIGGIPPQLANISSLDVLDLSSNFLYGEIPAQLANLSNLQVLYLGPQYYSFPLSANNVEWLSHLPSLRKLDLTWVDLSKFDDWQQINNKLPYLTSLSLNGCNLPHKIIPSSFSLTNSSTYLSELDLSNNRFSNSIYQWVFNYSQSLVHLTLVGNSLHSIPESFGNMTKLTDLILYSNLLEGEIPDSVWSLCALQTLDLSGNNLSGQLPDLTQLSSKCTLYSLENLNLYGNSITGTISDHFFVSSFKSLCLSWNQLKGVLPESIAQLTQLESLELSNNSLTGVITEAHFSKLSKLRHLDLSFNQLTLNISADWIPTFQLEVLRLRSCKIGPQFPTWFQNQNNLLRLDLSNSGISESIPNWLWNLSPKLQYLNLSSNQISGTINNFSYEFQDYLDVDLSSNQLEGSLPTSLFKVVALHLSRNRFSNIDSLCGISDDADLTFFDISYNQLYGDLPDCWSHFKSLIILILSNNKISGNIPISIGSLTRIETLHLGYNNLTGDLPSSLMNCTQLIVLDVGVNKLFGSIATWITNVPNLVILSLRSNHFYGSMTSHLCHLQNLQFLDLSSNNLSGSLPSCLGNFTEMKKSGSIKTNIEHEYKGGGDDWSYTAGSYEDEILLVWKWKLSKNKRILGLMKGIDLSSNKIMGEIPSEITELVGLVSLNLSLNNLSGQIPLKIGDLKSLDTLDLSRNHLVAQIPSSLTKIDRLNTLDLSNNHLSGKIPTSTQLQSFPPSSYMGNPELCGAPLPKKCQRDQDQDQETIPEATDQEADDELLTRGFYISMALGFTVAFWGVCGTLIFNKSFRYAYFKLLNEVEESICVTAAIHKAKILRMIES